jgi:predicted outer membrane repeat protein
MFMFSVFILESNVHFSILTSWFFQNSAAFGGAVHLGGNNNRVVQSEFIENFAVISGGAVEIISTISCLLKWNAFRNNSCGSNGGAISAEQNVNLSILGGIFSTGFAGHSGGAAFFYHNVKLDIEMVDCTENIAAQSGGCFSFGKHALILSLLMFLNWYP